MRQQKTSSAQGTGAAKRGKKVAKKKAARKAAPSATTMVLTENLEHVKKDIDGLKDDMKRVDTKLWGLAVLILIAPHLSKIWGG